MERAAFFDIDGTVTHSNVVCAYAHTYRKRLTFLQQLFWAPPFLCKCAWYVWLDQQDRTRFNRVFYRNYRDMPCDAAERFGQDCYEDYLKSRVIPRAKEQLDALRCQGFEIVFVTGSLDFMVRPLAVALGVDHVISARLRTSNGRFTGELAGDPVGGAEKARRVCDFAREHGLDLATCHAYGDSIADVPMLEAVGMPHVVRPDGKLRRLATKRTWPILEWRLDGSSGLGAFTRYRPQGTNDPPHFRPSRE